MIYAKRIKQLKQAVLSTPDPVALSPETVFLSVCDIKTRARVFHGSGNSLQSAWQNAEKRLGDYLKKQALKKPFAVLWAKADIVTHYEKIPTVDLNKHIVKNKFHNFTRLGLSFDDRFKDAFIEAEVNGNKMIDYKLSQNDILEGNIDYQAPPLNLANINHYRKIYYNLPPIAAIPPEITIFRTRAFFCGEDEQVYELYDDTMDFGRRRIDFVDDKVIHEVIVGASEYLVKLIDDNGKFIYGYFPIFGATMTNYNILRHTTTLWSILNLYRISGDESLIPKLEKAIGYLDAFFAHYDDTTVYLVEKETNEIKLGGNGVAIIMFTEYMDIFKTDRYVDIVRKLANGILSLQNPETGQYFHVLNADFSKKESFRTVYYDGEATFALARAYSYTQDPRFLDGARAAVEYFIRENYIIHRDHWVAYTLLEVTKHDKNIRYYEFALKNIEKNLHGIYQRETSFHTYLEMLMTGWQTYQRALAENIESEYIQNFDPTQFAKTIYHRARHMLNGYFYPEYAMYMKYPETVVGSFHVRHHNYRVRIDDVQHFIGGYYFYCMYFNEIKPYIGAMYD